MKKIFVVLGLMVLFGQCAWADVVDPRVTWVCIDKTGKEITCPKYKAPKQNDDILKEFEQDGLIGFKDKNGNVVIEPKFDRKTNIGRYVIVGDSLPIAQNKKYGLIDRKGNWLIKPQFDLLLGFNEGLAVACQNGKCGYVDKKGKWVIKPQFYEPMCYIDRGNGTYWYYYKCRTGSSNFSEGLAAVNYEKKFFAEVRVSEYEFKTYPIAVSKDWEPTARLNYGKIKDGIFYLETNVPEELKKQYEEADKLEYNEKCKKEALLNKNDIKRANIYLRYKSGYINKEGKLVIKDFYGDLGKFSEGLAAARKFERKYGYINNKGEWVISPKFEEASAFYNGVASIKRYRTKKEMKTAYKEQIKWFGNRKKVELKKAVNKEQKEEIEKRYKEFKEHAKREYGIKLPKKSALFIENEAFADEITPENTVDLQNTQSKPVKVFSIALLILILIAGFSIRKSKKRNK